MANHRKSRAATSDPAEVPGAAKSCSLLSANDAARHLGMSVTTLYDWLGKSEAGLLVIRGQPVTVLYYQGGPAGQGRIRIPLAEVERILELMRVKTQIHVRRLAPISRADLPGITVQLGRPDR